MKKSIVVVLFLPFLYGCTSSDSDSEAEKKKKPKTVKEILEEVEKENDIEIQDINKVSDSLSTIVTDTNVVIPSKNQIEDRSTTKSSFDEKNLVETDIKKKQQAISEEGMKEVKEAREEDLFDIHHHAEFNALLKHYVTLSGSVNYKGFKMDQDKLETYLYSMEHHPPQSDWNRNQKLAYWINLYNASTIYLIIQNYPLKSIMDMDKAWDKKFVKSGDQIYTLNEIENSIIRPKFKEPRIHFAVNCAAKSCPKLLNEVYTGTRLEEQLEKNTKNFILKSGKNELSGDRIKISKIFEWYADDFGGKGKLASYISKYAPEVSPDATVEFMEYDWSLNN